MANVIDFKKGKTLEAQVKEILEEATPKKPVRRRVMPAKGNSVTINGDGVSAQQIAGGDIHNYVNEKPVRPRVVLNPSPDCITETQKVVLTTLRDEWIALHNSVKERKLSIGAAQKRINIKAGVTSYHMIPAYSYDAVVKFVKQQMGVIRNMSSAPRKDLDWQAKRIQAIKARCSKQFNDPVMYKPYIKKKYSKESLADLTFDELQGVYAYVMNKKTS